MEYLFPFDCMKMNFTDTVYHVLRLEGYKAKSSMAFCLLIHKHHCFFDLNQKSLYRVAKTNNEKVVPLQHIDIYRYKQKSATSTPNSIKKLTLLTFPNCEKYPFTSSTEVSWLTPPTNTFLVLLDLFYSIRKEKFSTKRYLKTKIYKYSTLYIYMQKKFLVTLLWTWVSHV